MVAHQSAIFIKKWLSYMSSKMSFKVSSLCELFKAINKWTNQDAFVSSLAFGFLGA